MAAMVRVNGKELVKDAALWAADKSQESFTGFPMDWSQGTFLFKGSNIAINLAGYSKELSPGNIYLYDKDGIKRADGRIDDRYVSDYNKQLKETNGAKWRALNEVIDRGYPELNQNKPWNAMQIADMCYRDSKGWRQAVNPLLHNLDGKGGTATASTVDKPDSQIPTKGASAVEGGLAIYDIVTQPSVRLHLERHTLERATLPENSGPETVQARYDRIDEPGHPGHDMYRQAQRGLRELNAERNIALPDERTNNMAARLAATAVLAGLTRIDHVSLSTDNQKVVVAQGQLGSAFLKTAIGPVVQLIETPLAQSSQAFVEHQQQHQASERQSDQQWQHRLAQEAQQGRAPGMSIA